MLLEAPLFGLKNYVQKDFLCMDGLQMEGWERDS
jgi:hypothetical protein